MSLKKQIKKTTLFYLYMCLKRKNEDGIKEFILNNEFNKKFINDSNIIFTERRGEEYPDKLFCEISPVVSKEGFFATFRRTLDALYFADYYNAVPYIEYSQEFLYAEKEPVNGTKNPFEYYFSQTTDLSLSAAKNVIIYSQNNRYLAEKLNFQSWGYVVSDKYINDMSKIMAEYISLNEPTEEYIKNSIIRCLNKKRTLGVHSRGTDYRMQYKSHPNFVTTKDYFNAIDELLQKNNFEQIFLATDDNEILKEFKDRYGNLVVYYDDVYRGNSTAGVHTTKGDRENHNYKLGLEVVRDMYTLAACNGLVAGMSQVSMSARITNKAFYMPYESVCIIDKGLSQNGKIYK